MSNIDRIKEDELRTRLKNPIELKEISKPRIILGDIPENIKSLASFFQSIIIALGIATFLYIFVVTPSEVDGKSMEPTFFTGERLYTNRLTHWLAGTSLAEALSLDYKYEDIIVFQKPAMDALIKRIIAMPGDTIELKDGHFYLNSKKLDEQYLGSTVYTNPGTFLTEGEKIIVPVDSYFVAGDNRPVSNDSRYIGFIKRDWIIGKPFLRIWPLDRISTIN